MTRVRCGLRWISTNCRLWNLMSQLAFSETRNLNNFKPNRINHVKLCRDVGWVNLEILTITCLTFCLFLPDRPTLGLPKYKLKVVNICKMHGTGGSWSCGVVSFFNRFQRYVEIVRKWWKSSSKPQVRCKSIEATSLYHLCLLLLIFYDFWQKKWVKILVVPSFRLKLDDVTVTLSLIVLSWFFFTNLSWYYLTSCKNLLWLNVIFMVKDRSTFAQWGWLPLPPPPSTLPLSNFRAKRVGLIWKIFSWADVPRMSLQAKIFWEKLEKPVGGWHPPPPPPFGHRRVKASWVL